MPARPADQTLPARRVEVAIVGGGPAGLSAALVLGRARRSVAVVDASQAAHFVAEGVHGFLGQEGVPPRELRARAWRQLEPFDVRHVEGRVATIERVEGAALGEVAVRGARDTGAGFRLALEDGAIIEAATVILAGGLRYDVVDVPGLEALWGSRLFHCPFCHGWEVVGRRVGVVGPPPVLEHLLPLLALWADDLTGFAIGVEHAPAGAAGAAEAAGVVASVVEVDGVVRVTLEDGGVHTVDALFAPPVLRPADDLPEQLGLTREGNGVGGSDPVGVRVEPMTNATAVPGVFASGDLAGIQPSVANAVQSGAQAALGVVRHLIHHG